MSVMTVDEKLIVERAVRANQCAIAADAVVMLIKETEFLQEAWDLFDGDKKRAVRMKLARIINEIYQG